MNILYKNDLRFYQVPQALNSEGLLQELSRNELCLYLHLLSEMQRTSRVTVTASLEALVQHTGISISKVGMARAGLVFHGLVVTRKTSKGQEYTLTDPKTRMILNDAVSTNTFFDFNELEEHQLRAYYMRTLTDAIPTENGLSARCPFHDDSRPSLSVSLSNGGQWQCHGCKRKGVLIHFEMAVATLDGGEAIDSREAHKRILDTLRAAGVLDGTMGQPEATYTYCDDMGDVEFEVLRYPNKHFRMRRPDPTRAGRYLADIKGCKKLLYLLPDVCEAMTVIVTEGEKDVETLRALNLHDYAGQLVAATCNHGGVGKWSAEHASELRRKRVLLLGHTDPPGRKHMDSVAASIKDIATSCVMIHLPSPYKDVSEYLEKNSRADLIALIGEEWLDSPVSV